MAWRKYGIWAALAAFLCAGAGGLGGCAAGRKVITPGTGLSADTLRAGGLAVVGVTVVDEVEQVRPPLLEALERELRESRPDLAVLNAARVRDQLGVAAYRRILIGYQQEGVLGDRDRADLAEALRNAARFIILARVEQDAIHAASHGTFHLGNRTGSSGSVGIGMSSGSTKVRVMLYDLEIGREIQCAIYSATPNDPVPASVWNLPREPVVLRPDDPGTPREDPPPDVPDLVRAVLVAFRAFTNDLPGPVHPPAEP